LRIFRQKMSREKAIKPEELYPYFEQLKAETKANPYKVIDWVGKDATEVVRKKERPITFIGFEGWLAKNGIVYHLGHYSDPKNESYAEYLPIIARIKAECRADTVEGALSGMFNSNLAARIEGITEKSEVTQTNVELRPINVEFKTKE